MGKYKLRVTIDEIEGDCAVHKEKMKLKKQILLVFGSAVFLLGVFGLALVPSCHASNEFDSTENDIDVQYVVKIDENNRTVTVEATFENLEKDSFKMSFIRGGYFYKNSDMKCTILGSDESVRTFWSDGDYGWEMDVGSDNKIFVKYKIKNLNSVGPFTSTFFSQKGEVIFAIPPHPEEEKFDRKNEALVHLTVPENWTALGSEIWEKLDNYTFLVRNLYELQRVHVPVAAAHIRWEEKEEYYGIKTVFFVEESPEEEGKEELKADWAFSHQFDLNIRKDVKLISKRGAFAMNYFSEKWNVEPPRCMFISSLGLGGKAGFHYDFPWREQMEHEVGKFFVPSSGYFTQYLDSKVAAKYTGENRFLGKIYAKYLTYERGLKERLKEGVEGVNENIHRLPASAVYNRIKSYGYGPIVLQYLDGRIKEETSGNKSLHDVLRRVLDNRFYLAGMPGLSAGLGDPKFVEIIKEVTGVDFSNFFERHALKDYADGLPDIFEVSYGLDSKVEDSDEDGITDKREVRTIRLDGFAQEWQNLSTRSTRGTDGIIEKIETVRTENYLNIRVNYSKPLYLLKNSQINFGFDFNQDWSDGSDRYSFELGSPNVPIEGSLVSSLENYVYVGRQNLEFKIPIETLKILRFPEKASLRVYVRSDLEGPELGDGWDTDLGWGQIDNVNILGEYKGKTDFEIYDLNIGKKELKPGESTKVSIKVVNLGEARGSKIVNLSINGDIVNSENVVLGPNENRYVYFEISEDEEGTYEVSIGKLTEPFEVIESTYPPKFEVDNLSINKETVKPGESVTVSVQVTNTGGEEGIYTVELNLSGEIKTKNVTLEPNQRKEVTFEILKENPDNYVVEVGSKTGEFKVVRGSEEEKEKEELPLVWIGLGIGIIVVLVVGIWIRKKA